MKHKILLVLLVFTITTSQAQWIQSLTISPQNPTSNDTIRVYADCMFPSASCNQHTQGFQVNGNVIDAYALHCLGVLTMICSDIDTFLIPPQPAGNYTFVFNLSMGQLPSPCTPGVVPDQIDSISFVVSPLTGTGEYISSDEIVISPNPTADYFSVSSTSAGIFPAELKIISVDGKAAGSYYVEKNNFTTDIKHLPSGYYLVQLNSASGKRYQIPLMISR